MIRRKEGQANRDVNWRNIAIGCGLSGPIIGCLAGIGLFVGADKAADKIQDFRSDVAPGTPTETATAPRTPRPTSTPRPTETPVANAKLAGIMAEANEVAAQAEQVSNESGVYQLMDSDGNVFDIDLSEAVGFTPDSNLRISEITPNELGAVPAGAEDFQAYLNTARDGFGPLAGFTDGTNDYNQYYDNLSAPQVPVYSWMVHTGLSVDIPGIGRVEGGEGRAAAVVIINRTDRVHRFETNSVEVIAGFQGWGRIWDGDAEAVQETEERLVQHYRHRLGEGVAESGFIGQCDQGEQNCDELTVVTVELVQWGNKADGTPRDLFRLIRAETVSTTAR